MTDHILSEKIILNKLRFAMTFDVGQQVLESLHVSIDVNEMASSHIVRGMAELWGQTFTKQRESWPRDWWQAFKQRWFEDGWIGPRLLQRWPVRYSYIEFDPKVIYPKIALPGEDRSEILTIHRGDYP